MVVDPKLIGISGKIGNGKDLLFDVINYIVTEDYWTSFEHYMHESTPVDLVYQNKKFAGILKDIACKLIGCNVSQLEDRKFKEKELGEEWWYCVADDGSYIPYVQNLHEGKVVNLVKLTPRKLLQLLGTEAGRQIIHPNIWVNALFADYKKEWNGKTFFAHGIGREVRENVFPNWIITDVRFPNEAKAVKDKGGIMIRINRPGTESHCGGQHLSETSLDAYDKFDYLIENDGTVQDLIDKVKSLNIVERIL
jgi:hypothetical protein